jgi:hypothetical protein
VENQVDDRLLNWHKIVNANAITQSDVVKTTMSKSFRFGGKAVRRVEALVA